MNLRIIKKLSKKAMPLLVKLGSGQGAFLAGRCRNYHAMHFTDRTHWDRGRCHPSHLDDGETRQAKNGAIYYRTRAGNVVSMRPSPHPLKGTPMVGGMSGYYEPEWDERCAWAELEDIVFAEFCEWIDYEDEDDIGRIVSTRRLNRPADVLQAARELVARKREAA